MMKTAVCLLVCLLLHISTTVHGEDASSSSSSSSGKASAAAAVSNEEVLRNKRAVDMRRLARGIQMLRLGKRSSPWWLPASDAFPEDDPALQDLLSARDSPYYDQQEFPNFPEEPVLYSRYRRSAVENPSHPSEEEASADVKRSVGFLDGPAEQLGDEGFVGGDPEMDKRQLGMLRLGKRPVEMLRLGKRPVRMLRLGKRPVGMLRLGKRPVGMLRLGKRPMSMLRLGKREGDDEGLTDMDGGSFYPSVDEEQGVSADKRPVGMLRLGKRPVGMLRLGKRPIGMLRLGKRPIGMLRLGKRQLPMLRLGKRAAE